MKIVRLDSEGGTIQIDIYSVKSCHFNGGIFWFYLILRLIYLYKSMYKERESMDKNIQKVRKSIERRKKMRGMVGKENSEKQLISPIPQDEEKHGYYPVFTEPTSTSAGEINRRMAGFAFKGILSVILFFGASLIMESDQPLLSQVKHFTGQAMTEEFPFAKVNIWYQETFGSPLAFTSEERNNRLEADDHLTLPVMGSVKESFQANGKGIMISPDATTNVSSMHEGVIIFSGNDRETNKTVVVQHADGSETTYGNLSEIDVHLYQFVTANQKIGTFTPTQNSQSVYFSIEKDDQYIDPVQVIQVDDIP